MVRISLTFLKFSLEDILSLKDINRTFIILLPKKSQANTVDDYSPITLCNVVHKIISKVICNRLMIILLKMIGPFQSAFLKGGMISYNYIIAYEVTHSFKTKRKARQWELNWT